jgi:tripartite-type tricarboxylate transporter receptor subunit TctC
MQEPGITGPYEVSGWYGVSAAVGTPAAIVERLSQGINRALELPDVRECMSAEVTVPIGASPRNSASWC